MALINSSELSKNKIEYTLGYINPEWPTETKEHEARLWRDAELKKSDWIASVTDHGMYNAYIAYRQALRDWPSTSNFPNTKPEL